MPSAAVKSRMGIKPNPALRCQRVSLRVGGLRRRRLCRCPERGTVDRDGDAVVSQAIEHGVDEGLALKKWVPIFVGEVRGNYVE